MYLLMLAVIVVSTQGQAAKLPLTSLRNNRLLPNTLSANTIDEAPFNGFGWVIIKEAPPKVFTQPMGTHVELECLAEGSPSPRIQWLKENTPLTEAEDYESNSIDNAVGRPGYARVKSRLIINNLLPIHEGTFTCYAESGTRNAAATTNLYVSQGDVPAPHNFTEFLSSNVLSMVRNKARIVLWKTIAIETIGSNVILPCKTVGTPKPDIYWVDNNEQFINNQDPRIKILPDGELSIKNLRWSDMGNYSCISSNSFSKDTISTFIYPLLNEK